MLTKGYRSQGQTGQQANDLEAREFLFFAERSREYGLDRTLLLECTARLAGMASTLPCDGWWNKSSPPEVRLKSIIIYNIIINCTLMI